MRDGDLNSDTVIQRIVNNTEESYCVLFEQASDGIFIISEKERVFKRVNTSLCQMFGFSKEQLLNKRLDEVVSADTIKTIEADLAILSSKKSIVKEWKITAVNGTKRFLEVSIVVLSNGCFQGIARDVTKRKETEYMLTRQRQQLSTILSNTPDIIARFDRQFKIVYINPVVEKFTGKSAQEFINKSYEDLGRFEDAVFWRKIFAQVFATGKPATIEFSYNCGLENEYFFHALIVPEFGDDGNVEYILRIARDITEQTLVRRQLERLERLNLIGEMAAGIGHEIRNPLTTVRGFLQILKKRNAYQNDKENFNLMIDELDRANTIITEFLSLAKNKMIKLEKKNLNSIVNAIFPLIQAHAMMFDVYLKLELQSVPDIMLDEKEIRQLIFNLACNGIEAMLSGGCLLLSTAVDENGKIVLAVKDQGTGIAPEIKNKIGTPFFTTKDSGTGLGLAICYSIAARHNADINFETGSEGTTFYVKFGNINIE